MYKITLVISVYNNIDFLDLVLDSLNFQTVKDFEVIVSEDCEKQEMKDFISKKKNILPFPVKHIFHEDVGFRKNILLNRAIRISEADFIVFIDGDCILHNKFIESYCEFMRLADCVTGRRVGLNKKITKQILETKNSRIGTINALLNAECKKEIKEAFYIPFIRSKGNTSILGSNFGVKKGLLMKINGFDEDYLHACIGEDVDLEMRLKKAGGVRFASVKNRAIQYHLYHERGNNRAIEFEINNKLFEEKKKNIDYRCKNGLY
ncbi:glycosyltransferase [bacterium]|nr:glycosyltransferase [bacterium]MBU1753787.1 glycosyltransferase [bacterium]